MNLTEAYNSLCDEVTALKAALAQAGAEVERLKNDLADALDVKAGSGPTALSMVVARAEQAEAALARVRAALEDWHVWNCGCDWHGVGGAPKDRIDPQCVYARRAALEGR